MIFQKNQCKFAIAIIYNIIFQLNNIFYYFIIINMSEYTLNGNIWGGSFILEASTDGISWDVMVAKSSNNTF